MTLAPCPQCGTNTTPGLACTACGTPTPALLGGSSSSDPYLGQWEAIQSKLQTAMAPKYVVKGILGYGGMAGVYLADEPRLGRKVAIKVMAPGLMVDPKLVERFEQEARTIAQLSHPNIVTIYEVDNRDDLHWFTMTYVAGRTLGQVLHEGVDPLPIPVVCSWLYQIGDALAFAHNHGIVHRDIKPGNVLIDTRGNALVTDFGIAKVADADTGLTRTGMLVGTPAYMSPEQCSSGAISGASDQYSLGTVAYQMLTGQPPFAGQTLAVLQAHMSVEPTPIQELRPDCPDKLAQAIQSMLQKRPDDRWESISAAVQGMGAQPAGLEGALRDQLKELASLTVRIKAPGFPENVREGSREFLSVQLQDASARALPQRRIEWTSSDPAIACVTTDQTLHALSPGTAYIGAYSGAGSLSLRVNVEADAVRALKVREPGPIVAGESRTLAVEVLDIDDTPLADRAVLWTSSDHAVATVSPTGVVQALAAGTATLTGRTGTCTAQTTITVTPAKRDAKATSSPATMHASAVRAVRSKSLTSYAAPPPKVEKPANRKKLAMVGGAAFLVIAAVTAFALLKPSGKQTETPTQTAESKAAVPPATPPVNEPQVATGDPQPTTTAETPALPENSGTAQQQNKQPQTQAQTKPVPTTPQPPPVNALTGELVLLGNSLPDGAKLTVTDASGTTRSFDGPRMRLDAGRYVLEFNAPGYQTDLKTITLRAGDTQSWSPALAKVVQQAPTPTPIPVNPPTVTTQPAVDTRADEAAVKARLTQFVASFSNRDKSVLDVIPSAEAGLRAFVTEKSVGNFRATVDNLGTPSFTAGSATVPFAVKVFFRVQNENQDKVLSLIARFDKTGRGWDLVSVRQSSN